MLKNIVWTLMASLESREVHITSMQQQTVPDLSLQDAYLCGMIATGAADVLLLPWKWFSKARVDFHLQLEALKNSFQHSGHISAPLQHHK